MVRQLELPAEINRNAPPPTLLAFKQFFKGFEGVPAVRKVFGEETEQMLENLKVEFCSTRFGYMAVSHKDAHLIVSAWHLKNSDTRTLYLDIVHELFHVGQFRNEKDSFITGYEHLVRNPTSYFTNPIEIAAYKHTVEEALRIGTTVADITEYLQVPWASPSSFRTFLKRIGLQKTKKHTSNPIDLNVTISKAAPIQLRPFTDYFRYENVPAVRSLFGNNTDQILDGLKVEFESYPLDYLRMNDEDGHLEISKWHLRDSDISILYLDLFLYLQFVHEFMEGKWDFAFLFINGTLKDEARDLQDYVSMGAGFKDYRELVSVSRKTAGFTFLDSAIAIEAYRATVAEGRRIGMSETELREYAGSPGLPMTKKMLVRFFRNLGIGK